MKQLLEQMSLIKTVGRSIQKVRAEYTKPYGNKLRTVKGRHSIDLVRTAYQGVLKGHINQEEFEKVIVVASSITEIPPDVLLTHFALASVEEQLEKSTWHYTKFGGDAS
jgi:hypothetical protein